MASDRFLAEVQRTLGDGRARAQAPLAPLTTFRVGGPAELLADLQTVEELTGVLRLADAAGAPVTVLGGGSNVVVADAGLAGLVVRLGFGSLHQVAADEVRAGAGVTINGLVRWTIGRGLSGLEAWAGTPGTVGGAVYGNAHWARHNIGERVRRVLLATRQGDLQVVESSDLEFAYDRSRLQRTGEILVWADLAASPGDARALRERARESLHYRKATQPLALPSAGCIFQNPDPSIDRLADGIPASAGALIDRAGLKGRRLGGAAISDRHANFIVNEGSATAADIRALAETARRAVAERVGVALRDEVVWLGA